MKTVKNLSTGMVLTAFLSACGGGGGGGDSSTDPVAGPTPIDSPVVTPDPGTCDQAFSAEDIYIVDLSQDSQSGGSCYQDQDREATAECVETRVRQAFSDATACLGAFDVFVPGTNQEDGNYQQFTSIVSPDPGRTYLSVQYTEEATVLDDGIQYDKSVGEASNALDNLLYALKVNFNTTDIRVFGHSKGSDAVARVSTYPEHDAIEFFAFAQAGRTPDSIRGLPGYIEKLGDNLVGITWQNDEVQYYSGGSDGFQTPEIWGFPGYVNQEGGGLALAPLRLDHHNNYGGDYVKRDYPYCTTGNKAAMVGTSECNKQDGVRYLPFFWGDEECTDKAFEMMRDGYIGERYQIGFSGPRATACKDTIGTIAVDYELIYRINIADQDDCEYTLDLAFEGLDLQTNRVDGGDISITTTRDTEWIKRSGTMRIPPHMKLAVEGSMKDVSGALSNCINYLNAQSEGYIDKLSVSFNHPLSGTRMTRTLIGNAEGIEYIYPLKMADKNNVAWRKSGGDWDLHYGIPAADITHGGALMIKGKTTGGVHGEFYKWVHLLD